MQLNLTHQLAHKLMLACTELIFTPSSEMELRVHMDYVHDKENPDFDTTHKCKVCKKKFLEKCELLKHIKSQHENSVQACKFFLRGIWNFEDTVCWHKHDKENKSKTRWTL